MGNQKLENICQESAKNDSKNINEYHPLMLTGMVFISTAIGVAIGSYWGWKGSIVGGATALVSSYYAKVKMQGDPLDE
jgi:hypothetical protein